MIRDAAKLSEEALRLPATGEERLYNVLSRDRFAGRLDLQINVTELMRGYGVSRSLVERVLARLAEEGLVEREAGRGWRFLPTVDNPDVYEESYRFRLIIEPMAIMDPGFSADPNRIEELKKGHVVLIEELAHHMPSRLVVEADAEFHETIGEWSHNRFILQAIQQQTKLRRLMEFQYSLVDPERMMQSCQEHLEILEALERDDRQRAVEVLRHHIGVARDIFPDFIER